MLQGSKLGPDLFNLFSNDLEEVMEDTFTKFVVDSTLVG